MVPKLLTKTPASSRSAYPKMAIFAQIRFPSQPGSGRSGPSGARIGVNRARPQRCGGLFKSSMHHFSCENATRKMLASDLKRPPHRRAQDQKRPRKGSKKSKKVVQKKSCSRHFFEKIFQPLLFLAQNKQKSFWSFFTFSDLVHGVHGVRGSIWQKWRQKAILALFAKFMPQKPLPSFEGPLGVSLGQRNRS